MAISSISEEAPVTALDCVELRQLLPQRFPFLMIDRVISWESGRRIRAIKNVTANEIQFMGHFPDRPVMPGVFIIEAMAQAVLALDGLTRGNGMSRCYLSNVNVRFIKPVQPGDQLVLEAEIVKLVGRAVVANTSARVGDLIVAKGEVILMSRLEPDDRAPGA